MVNTKTTKRKESPSLIEQELVMSSDSEASQLVSIVSSDDPNSIKPQEKQVEVCSPTKISKTLNTDIPGVSTESVPACKDNSNKEAVLVKSAETEAYTAPTNLTETNINVREYIQVSESVNQITSVIKACHNTAKEMLSLTAKLTKNACNELSNNTAIRVDTGDTTDVQVGPA